MSSSTKRPNLILIGMRCTGKTSAGRRAAEHLGLAFVDTDEVVVERTGRSIREIFESDGESAFRKIEAEVVADVAVNGGLVIATGGGVVLDPASVQALRRSGTVVHLVASPEIVHKRLLADRATDGQRPALTDAADELEEIRQVWAAREALYEDARHETVSAEEETVEHVAGQIARIYEQAAGT